MWFDSAHRPLPPPPWDVAFTIQRSEFRGQERVEIFVVDLRAAGASPATSSSRAT
jgi:single-stranded-DNA-specific exonuclease